MYENLNGWMTFSVSGIVKISFYATRLQTDGGDALGSGYSCYTFNKAFTNTIYRIFHFAFYIDSIFPRHFLLYIELSALTLTTYMAHTGIDLTFLFFRKLVNKVFDILT